MFTQYNNVTHIDFTEYSQVYDDYLSFTEIEMEIRQNKLFFRSKLIIYLLPIIICIGIFGNILNMIVFNSKKMKKCSTFRFLLYLSIFDLLVLSICASDAFLRFGYQIEIRNYHIIICRLHTFLTYFLTHASSTILMIISIDRAFVVSNKKIYFSLLRFKKFERIEKKEPQSYLCGLSLCCILNCRMTSNLEKEKNSKWNRSDLKVAFILIILFLINGHFLLLLNLNPTKNFHKKMATFNIEYFTKIKTNESFNYDQEYGMKKKEAAGGYFCYPYQGKFLMNNTVRQKKIFVEIF